MTLDSSRRISDPRVVLGGGLNEIHIRSAAAEAVLQGATASLQAITGMIGPTLFTQVFAQSIAKGDGLHVPGMAFFVAAAMLAAAGVIAWRVTRVRA